MTSEETWTWDELFDGLVATDSFVQELERLELLRVVGRDAAGRPIYGAEARETLERVMALVDAGYDPRDIAVIAHKVGLKRPRRRTRRRRRAETFVKLDELADRAGVAPAKIEGWVAAGALAPSLVTEGGERLFPARAVDDARACDDLLALGLSDEDIAAWRALVARIEALEKEGGVPAPAAVAEVEAARASFAATVEAAIRRRKKAIGRWEKRLAKLAKRIDKARRRRLRRPR